MKQEQAQTTEIEARTRRVNELLDYEKRNIDANITQSLQAAGASAATAARARLLAPKEAALLDKQNAEYVQMEIDGKKFTAKAFDLVKQRNDNIQKILDITKERDSKIRDARKDDVTMLSHSNKAEGNIKAGAPGGFAPKSGTADPVQLTSDMEMFHATSKNPYVYVLEDNSSAYFGHNTKVKKQELPTINGHRYTAQEVYDAATAKSMTVQQYMEQVFYPSLRQPVPWKVPKEPK